VTYTAAYTAEKIVSTTGSITIKANSLELESLVFMNFKSVVTGFEGVDIENNMGLAVWTGDVEGYSEELFVATNENVTLNPGASFDGSRWVVQTPGIAAKELGDEWYMRVYLQLPDGSYAYSQVTYNGAQKYAIGRFLNSSDEDLKRTLVAMLDYGAAAQVNFGYKTDAPANNLDAETILGLFPAYTEAQVNTVINAAATYASAYSADMVIPTVSADAAIVGDWVRDTTAKANIGVIPNLILEGIITNQYKVTLKGAAAGITVKSAKMLFWDAKTYEALLVRGEAFSENNATLVQDWTDEDKDEAGRYVGAYDKTAAKNLGKTLYLCALVEATDGTVYTSGVIAHSAHAYLADRIKNSTDADMVALAKALVNYGNAAKIYFGPDEVVDTRLVVDPLTAAKLNAIPVANSAMSEAQLRQICVDFMRLQLSFAWTPSADFTYSYSDKTVTLYAGTVYGGLPYIGSTGGNIYNALERIDETTGVMDMSGDNLKKIIGNQCSASAFWGWARISNSLSYTGTRNMLPENGCLKVGDYSYDQTITDYHTQAIRTANICSYNGQQVMYESYAQLKMADGISRYIATQGHVCMVANDAVVVYNADGTINGAESYITCLEQVSAWKDGTQSNGSAIRVQGGVDTMYTFERLYKLGYLPFRIPELAGQDDVEKATASLSYTGTTVTASKLCAATLSANYAVSDLTVTVKDTTGKTVFTTTAPTMTIKVTSYAVSNAVTASELTALAGKGYTVEVSARVGTGEKLVAYTGKLV